jgi:hypothetical protein
VCVTTHQRSRIFPPGREAAFGIIRLCLRRCAPGAGPRDQGPGSTPRRGRDKPGADCRAAGGRRRPQAVAIHDLPRPRAVVAGDSQVFHGGRARRRAWPARRRGGRARSGRALARSPATSSTQQPIMRIANKGGSWARASGLRVGGASAFRRGSQRLQAGASQRPSRMGSGPRPTGCCLCAPWCSSSSWCARAGGTGEI